MKLPRFVGPVRRFLSWPHQRLVLRYNWYRRWHETPHHHRVHRRIATHTALTTTALVGAKALGVLALVLGLRGSAGASTTKTWTLASDWQSWSTTNIDSTTTSGSLALRSTNSGGPSAGTIFNYSLWYTYYGEPPVSPTVDRQGLIWFANPDRSKIFTLDPSTGTTTQRLVADGYYIESLAASRTSDQVWMVGIAFGGPDQEATDERLYRINSLTYSIDSGVALESLNSSLAPRAHLVNYIESTNTSNSACGRFFCEATTVYAGSNGQLYLIQQNPADYYYTSGEYYMQPALSYIFSVSESSRSIVSMTSAQFGAYTFAPRYISHPKSYFNPTNNSLIISQYANRWDVVTLVIPRASQIAATANGGTSLTSYDIDSGQPTLSAIDNNGTHWHANIGDVCYYADETLCTLPANNYLFHGQYNSNTDNIIADISHLEASNILIDRDNRIWLWVAGWYWGDYQGASIRVYENNAQKYIIPVTFFGETVANQAGDKIYVLSATKAQEFNVDSVSSYASSGEITTSFAPNPGQNNDWESYSATTDTPANTSLAWQFSSDNSTWYSSLASVPNSTRLYIKGSFATTSATATPRLDDLTITYSPVVVSSPSKTWTTQADFNTFTHTNDAVTADGDGATALATSGGGSGSWSTVSGVPSLPSGWQYMVATADNNIWISGGNGVVQYNGSSWTTHSAVISDSTIGAMYSFGQNDTWVFGNNGTVAHWNGSSWSTQTVTLADSSRAIFASAWGTDSSHLWAGATGAILYYNGSSWTQQVYPGSCIGIFNEISGTSTSEVWASNDAGWGGTGCSSGWRFNGTSWATALDAAPIGITSVYSPENNKAWFTDYIGSSVYYAQVGSYFTSQSVGASYLKDIDGSGPTDIWAVGTLNAGYNYTHYDGSTWTPGAATLSDDLMNVDSVSSTSVYAISSSELYHYSASGGTYQSSGQSTVTYTPSAGTNNRWQSDVLETTLPTGTAATVSYSADNSNWFSSIASVPASESLYVKLALSTSNTSVTPLVTALTVYYEPISITYSLPEGGQTIRYNTTDRILPIAWSASGSISGDHIRLQYSTNSGSTWTDISGATAISRTATNYNWTLPAINSSQVRVKVNLEDSSNNVLASASTSSDLALLYDATAPTLTVTASSDNANPNIATTGNVITIGVTSNETLAAAPTVLLGTESVSCTGSGTSYSCTYTVTESSSDGKLMISVNAIDLTGNSTTDTSHTFTITFSIPRIGINTPGNGSGYYASTSSTVTVSGYATDSAGISSVTSSYAGTVSGTTAWSQTVSLNLGSNDIVYTATNSAGRKAETTITISYYPGSAPNISITTPTTAGVYVANVAQLTISGTASGNSATLSSVTSSDASATVTGTTTWSQTVSVPANSEKTVTYYATDEYGRISMASLRLIHDGSAPTIAVTTPSASGTTYYTNVNSITISGTANAPSGIASVASSAAGTVTGTASWSQVVNLTLGSQTFTYTATDYLGQTAAVSLTVILDQTAPSISIGTPSTTGSYTTDQATVTVTGTAADNASLASVTSNDGNVTGTNSWSQDVSLTAGQTKNITYTATDAAGNTNSASIQINRLPTNPDVPDKPPVDDSAPDPVRNLRTYISSSSVILEYSPVLEGQMVRIWRSTDGAQTGDLIGETNSTTFTDSAVTVGTTYYYTLVVVKLNDGRTSTAVTTTATIHTTIGWAVSLTPNVVSLKPGGQVQMQATVYDVRGQQQNVPVVWSADPKAGTIDQNGLFSATNTVGDYYQAITASVDYQGLTGSASTDVFVDAQDNVIAFFGLDPNGATVAPGGNTTFRIYALNQNGASLAISNSQVNWQARAGGQISNGVFTAGSQTGVFERAVVASYTDPQGQTWTAYGNVTVSSESPRLTYITMTGTQRIPTNSSTRFYSYAYDQFDNRIYSNTPTLFAVNDVRAGQIDSIGTLRTGSTEGCFYWSILAEKTVGSDLARARSGVVTTPISEAEIVTKNQRVIVGLRQFKFVHQPNSDFSFTGIVYDGWGRVQPHKKVIWRLSGGTVGSLTENGQYRASGQTGLYRDALEVYVQDTNTGATTLYQKYPLLISTEDSRPTALSTNSVSAAANSASYSSVRVYDQFGLTYFGSVNRRYTLLGGNSRIYQNGLVETGDPEFSRNVIIGYLTSGLQTATASQGNVMVGPNYAPVCSATTGTDPSGDGHDVIDDDTGTNVVVDPEQAYLPGSLVDQAYRNPTSNENPVSLETNRSSTPLKEVVSWIQKILTPLSALAILTSLPTVLAGLLEALSQLFGRFAAGLANLLQAITSYRRPRAYGQVIDGRTKMPVAGANVQLLTPDTRRVIDSRQTDSAGRYIMIATDRRSLILSINAANYRPYSRLVKQESIHQIVKLGLEIEHDEPALKRRLLWQRIFTALSASRTILLTLGTVTWIITLLDTPTKLLFYLGIYYLFAWILEWYITTLPRPFGVVKDANTQQPLSQAVVRIFNRRQRLIGTEITDSHGRFRSLLTPGVYSFNYAKAGYDSVSHLGAILPKAARSFRVDADLQRHAANQPATSQPLTDL